jgi:hypothetical protein
VPRAGIDSGGMFKEFFTSLCKEVLDTERGLWLANNKNELYPNPHAYATERKSSPPNLNRETEIVKLFAFLACRN